MTAGANTNYSTGIEIADSAALGTQSNSGNPSDNKWTDAFKCNSNIPSATPGFSKFDIRTGSVYDPDAGSCTPQILTSVISGSSFSCTNVPPIIHFDLLDSIAENRNSSPSDNVILAKQALTNIIWNNSALLSDSILNAFNDSISGTTLGEIMAADTGMINGSGFTAFEYYCIYYLTPASNIETNIQTVGQIYLNTLSSGSITHIELAILNYIANKCPYTDGIGVYQARTLYGYFADTVIIYNDDGCGSHGAGHRPIKRKENKDTVNNISFNLYPNPNNGSFTLAYNLGNETSGRFEIYNEMGMKVGEYLLSSSNGIMPITTRNLTQGLYFYKVFTDTGIKKVGKIIIIR